ncbi:PREDICTED: uncharacterized protein LOC104590759 [Nelumbo nucifera]|uniref:Uncharacterized protein LOC104590759 n=2 Tax=Nelumbo nucifera TaxID=4432 RepID=A0A1U7ZHW0_NELNU|nr:PREDICTED: uncharacterized protein LOC104590759 [Nelumbo nucifera]DAD48313.1 TPA_asm: hypothetical protein HUJ06_018250 [Nelumbo nucifera]
MKGMKGRFLKKLKSMRPISFTKPGLVLQANASDGFLDPLPHDSTNWVFQSPPVSQEKDQKISSHGNLPMLQTEIMDGEELTRDVEDEDIEETELGSDDSGNKENIGPPIKAKDPLPAKENSEVSIFTESGSYNLRSGPLSELDVSSFRLPDPTPAKDNSGNPHSSGSDTCNIRRPDLNSGSLFDPNLLATFQQAVMIGHMRPRETERKARIEQMGTEKEEEPPCKLPRIEHDTLSEFQERCPPGGRDSVILYTTSLRGIRKTFEDCRSIRFLLGSFRILFYERDVSMHMGFREELWRIMGGRVVPPRLFIRGRYIGGADEVVSLHEQGKLLPLLQGVPADRSGAPCDGCAGIRFVLCFNCNGSCKVNDTPDERTDDGWPNRCPECNENGLIICPMCC